MTIDTELQAQVDAQLLEQGAFAPLEMLFNTGRLLYADYEAWRRREIEMLDDVLMGDRDRILAELEQAVAYARNIGLIEQPQELAAWGTEGGRPLRASAVPRLQQLIGNRYLRAQNAPQMDLFFDNPVVALTSGLARSLSARNLAESQRLLDRLYVQAPTHPDLATFDQLVATLDEISRPVDDCAARLELLTGMTPKARHLLGPGARDYLAPVWRHLADALTGQAFVPADPNLHRSFALSQAQDWAGVSESILGDPNWWSHIALCLRLTESAFRRRRRVEALTAWCHLCWTAPDEADGAVQTLRQPDLSTLWQAFLDSEEDVSDDGVTDSTLPASDFPAWLLLHEPGLARQLPLDLPRGQTPSEDHYRTVHKWIHANRTHKHDEEIAIRRTLQLQSPPLFWILKTTVRPSAP